jgi:ribose transport system substrate-binding protein
MSSYLAVNKGGPRMSNRLRRRAAFATLAIAVGLTVGACGEDEQKPSAATTGSSSGESAVPKYRGPEASLPAELPEPTPGEAVTVGVLNPSNANELFRAAFKAFDAEMKRLGGKTIIVDSKLSVDKQVSDFELFLGQNVDAVAMYPLDPSALRPALDRAKAEDVPVIGMDVTFGDDLKAPGVLSQVWIGRDREAFLQAAALRDLKPNATTGLITFSVPVPSLTYLREREEYWAGKFGLDVVGVGENSTDDAAGGADAMSTLLSDDPELEAVIAYNDPSALGAYTTARSAGMNPLPTMIGLNGGSDGLEGVRSGRLQATVRADAVGMGVQAARASYMAATGKGSELPPVVAPPPELVTSDNVDEIPSWDEQIAQIG